MINITTMNNGISVFSSTATKIMNISSMSNQNRGIHVRNSTNTTMMNNQNITVYIQYSSNTAMMNNIILSSVKNQNSGIYVEHSNNIKITDLSSFNHQDVSNSLIFLQFCNNISIHNVSIAVNYNGLLFFYCQDIILEESSFSGIISNLQTTTTDVADQPAIITLYSTDLVLKNCNFTRNSIAVTSSNITVEGDIFFENNSAISGTAFIFSTRSVLIVSEQSNVVFRNNSASHYGAVFYTFSEEVAETSILIGDLIKSGSGSFITTGTQCFIQVKGLTLHVSHSLTTQL